jgi:Leucine-rich repeat (LRR) protein
VCSDLDLLTLLDLADNQLSQLPANIGYLVELQTLNLRHQTSVSLITNVKRIINHIESKHMCWLTELQVVPVITNK